MWLGPSECPECEVRDGGSCFHRNLFPIRRLDDKGRGISPCRCSSFIGGSFRQGAPRPPSWEEALGPPLWGSGLRGAAYGFQGGTLLKGSQGWRVLPLPGQRTRMCVSYKAVAAHFRGRREFQAPDVAGQGFLDFQGTRRRSHTCMPSAQLVCVPELTVFEILGV